ncbi:lytic transglycosylase domain-containing protein [Rhizobium sp. KVB221]|uniref:Lytic transglycosylase domain-containing protein n=1 Tax=Rhizobium setariae TaxID=2801340 RepID=A0A937CJI8_9HYPH|nr:lytic transglycosylase domain-containing protein [Rhizobium setariae]MBL0371150.1 lytic transglycosylase domain-containing protein [Rhizobium setariae]
MKQALIAIAVLAAGGGTVWALLGSQPEPVETLPDTSIATLSIKSDRIDKPVKALAVKPRQLMLEPSGLDANVVAKPKADPVPSATLTLGLKALSIRDSLKAIAARDQLAPNTIEWKTLTWAIAVSGQTAVPATELAMARGALADWPALSDIDTNYEQALYREYTDAQLALSAFADRLPQTPEGAIILSRAALATGDKARAQRILRSLWHDKILDAQIEDKVIAEFGTLLDGNDHRQRMVRLLFAEKLSQAKRFSEMAKSESLYEAFSAVSRKSKDRKQLLAAVDKKWRTEPAFVYASIKYLRQAKRFEEAATLFEKMPREAGLLGDPSAWWVEARIVSRGLMDVGDAKAAYRLASAHVAQSPTDIAEAEFHAGWYALRGLKNYKDAASHFRVLLQSSARAHDQARGYYWLGRTAQASKTEDAKVFYSKAALYPATFYGQLAAAKLKTPIMPAARYQQGLEIMLSFSSKPEMQAITLLEKTGQDGRARRMYLALARSLESPSELQALAEYALKKHGPSLALAIGKAALKQGHDPGLAAFPLGAIPETADISGAGKALAYAIARQESAFNPSAVSPANAKGLLQILPSTAKKVAQKYQLAYAEEKLVDDPAFNATLGSHYLGEQISKFDGSYVLTFAAYNAGPGRIPQWIKRYGDPRGKDIDAVVDWVENIPFQETRDYVQRVMENYQVYKSLLNQEADIAADLTAGRR